MHYHITQEQRVELSLLIRLGHTQRSCVLVLGVSPSTVSRELRRNARASGAYHASSARLLACSRRAAANAFRNKLLIYPSLAQTVGQRLLRNDSPEQIAGELRRRGAKLRVAIQTIYDWIYRHARHLLKHLHCRKGKYRRTRESGIRKAFRDKQRAYRSIDVRPEHIALCKTYGHWEGDTIFGSDTKDRILTHIDRATGLLSMSLVLGYDSHRIHTQTVMDINRVFGDGVATITYDNGSEFAAWKKTELALGLSIYFADAFRSSQRGRNENANGLVRDYFPKGYDFKLITPQELQEVEDILNNRSRKRYNWMNPFEQRELVLGKV